MPTSPFNHETPPEWRSKPPEIAEIPNNILILICDASYKKGITGISTIIRVQNKQYWPIEYESRSEGPVHAELTAIKKGIYRVLGISKPFSKVVVYTDCRAAFFFLEELWQPNKTYIKSIIHQISQLVAQLQEKDTDIEFINVRSNAIKRIDKRALSKRKEIEDNKRTQIADRISKVDLAILRGGEYEITQLKDDFYTCPRDYCVSLDPLGCDCAWWKNNWGNKPYFMIRARALPCKHMCALADFLGKSIFEIFHKQITRVD